jgi:hypothetical protein
VVPVLPRAEVVRCLIGYSGRSLRPRQVGAVGSLALNPNIYIARSGLVPSVRVLLPEPAAKTDVMKSAPVMAHKQSVANDHASIITPDLLGSK